MLMKATGASLISAFLVISAATVAQAQTAKPTTKEDLAKKNVSTLSCEDFNGVDETFKPILIAWATGYHKGDKKPEDVVIDVAGIEKVMPFIIEACQKEPTASFWTKADDEMKKLF